MGTSRVKLIAVYFALIFFFFYFLKSVRGRLVEGTRRLDAMRIVSGSTRFATHPAILHTFIGNKMEFEEKYKVRSKGCEYLG